MNISKNTLLQSLVTKIDPSLKATIDTLSADGKVDLSVLSKGKNIQSLLEGLFKELNSGVQTKSDITSLLENNKNSLHLKTFSNDLKQLIQTLKTESTLSPTTLKLVTTLQNTLIDAENIDAKSLQKGLENSGIFLESKIGNSKETVVSHLKNFVNSLEAALKIVNTLEAPVADEMITNKPKETVVSHLKNIVNTLLEPLKEGASLGKNPLNTLDTIFMDMKKTIGALEEKLTHIEVKSSNTITLEVKNLEVKLNALLQLDTAQINNKELLQNALKELHQMSSNTLHTISLQNEEAFSKNILSNFKNVTTDIKVLLLQIQEQLPSQTITEESSKELKSLTEKLLSHIDYFQLSSFASQSNHMFLSFLQDEFEDVDLKFPKAIEDEFSCLIHLTLKHYGDLKILLQLEKTNALHIAIGVANSEFKGYIQSSLQQLRTQIHSIDLSILSVNVFDLDEKKQSDDLQGYGAFQKVDFGVDIKV